ncbi:unnamed protein product [Adineta steineri]|uniref:EF-hand domain-containing protein n=1 Tax=Adineta steineri TaxID=433720 RepID=A0A819KRL2_9BILA|nr:unnamed protein product [Adineta steineri]
MSSIIDNETGFSESDIHFARKTFIRDCPNGRCSKRKFLTFIRKSTLQKIHQSNVPFFKTLQYYRRRKKFFSMMFDIYDRNHDGELDFDEYLYALSALSGANRLRTIETLFCFFDTNNQGYITREEFNSRKIIAAECLGQAKTGIKDKLLYEQAFNTMDVDKDGRISKDEFIQWHLNDHLKLDETKSIKKRTRLLRTISNLVDGRGPIEKNPVDISLDMTMNINTNQESSSMFHIDQYLLNIFRQARNRFHYGKNKISDHQFDSGVLTSSSINAITDLDLTENSFQCIATNEADNELLYQSLEDVLIETLYELRQQRQEQRLNSNCADKSLREDQQSITIRL